MGCCSSSPEEPEGPQLTLEQVKTEIRKEAVEEKAAGKTSFLGSILAALEEYPEDTAILLDGMPTNS